MKIVAATPFLFLLVMACGSSKPHTATNAQRPAVTATTSDCPAGEFRLNGMCEKACKTDADCDVDKGYTCMDASEAGGSDGQRFCGGD